MTLRLAGLRHPLGFTSAVLLGAAVSGKREPLMPRAAKKSREET
jgi:hypothetical protein